MSAAPSIRRCTVADVPWLVETGSACYDRFTPDVDWPAMATYAAETIPLDSYSWLRGEFGFVAATIILPMWKLPHCAPNAHDIFFCARPTPRAIFELLQIFERTIAWARECGCARFEFMGPTLWDIDISAIAKRLGATARATAYHIEF